MAQSLEGGYGRSDAAGSIRAEGTLGPKLVTADRRFGPALDDSGPNLVGFRTGRLGFMDQRQNVAVTIALQTHVLRTCPLHDQLIYDEEADLSSAFALAEDLVRHDRPYVRDFRKSMHELTDLLRETIAAAPMECPLCAASVIERPT
jgi:hypothetical protein